MTELSGFAPPAAAGVCTRTSIEPATLDGTNSTSCQDDSSSDRDAGLGARLLGQAALDGGAEAADAFADHVWWDVGEVQAHGVRATVVGVEALAGYERDLFLDGLEQELAGVDVRR